MTLTRRAFVAVALLTPFIAPRSAEAQRTRVPVVGVLSPWGPSAAPVGQREPFERGLLELGWTPGTTVLIDQRFADGRPERLPVLAAELVKAKVDVIVANAELGILAARHATTTIPIVMAVASDPVRSGHVNSLARPGGNITGLTMLAQGRIEPKQLELLKAAVPGLSVVGILTNRTTHPSIAEEMRAAARTLGIQLQTFEVSASDEIPDAFQAMASRGVGGVLVRADPLVLDNAAPQCAELAIRHRLPVMYFWPGAVRRRGGLMAYNVDLYDLHRRSASYVDRILKGAKPGDLPIEQPTKWEFAVNLKAAKAIGLTLPPSLLLRADQVIE